MKQTGRLYVKRVPTLPLLFGVIYLVAVGWLSTTALNPNVDGYLDVALAWTSGDSRGDIVFTWASYFWVAVFLTSTFGPSPVPAALLNGFAMLLAGSCLVSLMPRAFHRAAQLAMAITLVTPHIFLYTLSPSKDALSVAATVIACGLWVRSLISPSSRSRAYSYAGALAALVVLAVLRPPMLWIALAGVLGAWTWARLQRLATNRQVALPAVVVTVLFVLGSLLSTAVGGQGNVGISYPLRTVTNDWGKSDAVGQAQASPIDDQGEPGGDSDALVPASNPLQSRLVEPAIRTAQYVAAPLGSQATYEAVVSGQRSVYSYLVAAFASIIVIAAFFPLLSNFFREKRHPEVRVFNMLTASAVANLMAVGLALPIIHERYRISFEVLFIFSFFTCLFSGCFRRWQVLSGLALLGLVLSASFVSSFGL